MTAGASLLLVLPWPPPRAPQGCPRCVANPMSHARGHFVPWEGKREVRTALEDAAAPRTESCAEMDGEKLSSLLPRRDKKGSRVALIYPERCSVAVPKVNFKLDEAHSEQLFKATNRNRSPPPALSTKHQQNRPSLPIHSTLQPGTDTSRW